MYYLIWAWIYFVSIILFFVEAVLKYGQQPIINRDSLSPCFYSIHQGVFIMSNSMRFSYFNITHNVSGNIGVNIYNDYVTVGRYFVVEWGNMVCTINATRGTFPLALTDDLDSLQNRFISTRHDFDNLTKLLTKANGGEPIPLHPASMRELCEHDSYELKRLMLSTYTMRMNALTYSSLPSHKRRRIEQLVDSRMERTLRHHLYNGHYTQPVTYKDITLSASKYKTVCDARTRLNESIKLAIKDRDWKDVAKEIRRFEWVLDDRKARLSDETLERLNELAKDEGYILRCDCGHVDDRDNTHYEVGLLGRDDVCIDCFDEYYVYVEDEDAYWHTDDAYYHESDGNYYSYEEAGDDDEDDDGLRSYSTNVLGILSVDRAIKSSHFGDFLLGVELEMCAGSDFTVREAAEDVIQELGPDYCIAKSDGSLPRDGFEIVTAPRGLTEHIKRFKEWVIKSSYRAWNSGECGLHVHIDSRAFNALTLGKFIKFINADDNADFIRKLAGRHPLRDEQARQYCAAESQSILANPKTALKGKDSSRYRMVNTAGLDRNEMRRLGMDTDTCNGGKFNTVELRIFRASLKKERLLSQIEFTHAAVMFCRTASMLDLTESAFRTWLSKRTGSYPSLAKWYEVAPKKKANPNTTASVSSDESVSA